MSVHGHGLHEVCSLLTHWHWQRSDNARLNQTRNGIRLELSIQVDNPNMDNPNSRIIPFPLVLLFGSSGRYLYLATRPIGTSYKKKTWQKVWYHPTDAQETMNWWKSNVKCAYLFTVGTNAGLRSITFMVNFDTSFIIASKSSILIAFQKALRGNSFRILVIIAP